MTFVYIDDYSLISKIITYLNLKKIKYTTDLDELDNCENLLISSISNKAYEIMKRMSDKKIIFILYNEELKILNNINNYNQKSLKYKSKIYSLLNYADKIITSMPYFEYILKKKIKAKFEIIPFENINLITKKNLLMNYSKYKVNKKKIIVLIIDFKYKMISNTYLLANKYSDINYIYVGYKPDYLLSNSDKNIIKNMPKNVIKFVDIDQRKLEEIVRLSKLVIFNDNVLEKYSYLNTIMLISKQLVIKKQELCHNLFINSKNCYLFDNKDELIKRVQKYLKNEVANLSSNMLELIKDNNISKISDKFIKLLK